VTTFYEIIKIITPISQKARSFEIYHPPLQGPFFVLKNALMEYEDIMAKEKA